MTDEEVKNFIVINFNEYFRSIREGRSLRKVARLLYIFPTTPDEVENMSNQILFLIAYMIIMLRF